MYTFSIPTDQNLSELIGAKELFAWNNFCSDIDNLYKAERIWNSGGKRWTYEYKYRLGSKTLCALYAKPDCMGLMIIFGKAEREKVDKIREFLSAHTIELYDSATTYHDGKWVMFDSSVNEDDIIRLLYVKHKPNK